MNILITGVVATGKTNLSTLLYDWLISKGNEIEYFDELFLVDRMPSKIGASNLLAKYKGDFRKHLIFATQIINPDYLSAFDVHIELRTMEMGKLLWGLLPSHKPS